MEERLAKMYELQLIDDQLDELEELRGDLPGLVNELKFKIEDIKVQVDEKTKLQKESKKKITVNEDEISDIKEEQKKYKAQLHSVRTNKEYDALTKQIDHSEEKVTKLLGENVALEDSIQVMKNEIDEMKPQLDEFSADLKDKEKELNSIIKANEKEEAKLRTLRTDIEKGVKKSDYDIYMRIRKAKNGKGIAVVRRSSCSGCHNVIPSQRQLEIRQNRKIYPCEHCGRILISSDIADKVEGIINN